MTRVDVDGNAHGTDRSLYSDRSSSVDPPRSSEDAHVEAGHLVLAPDSCLVVRGGARTVEMVGSSRPSRSTAQPTCVEIEAAPDAFRPHLSRRCPAHRADKGSPATMIKRPLSHTELRQRYDYHERPVGQDVSSWLHTGSTPGCSRLASRTSGFWEQTGPELPERHYTASRAGPAWIAAT